MVETNNETIEHKPQTINHPWNYVGSCLELPIVYYQTRPFAVHDQNLNMILFDHNHNRNFSLFRVIKYKS